MKIFLAPFLIMLFATSAFAENLEIFDPHSRERRTFEMGPNDRAELTIYLKTFGDPLDNFKVAILDKYRREVGTTISGADGIIKFTNLPPGYFIISVEKKKNLRGGDATVSVGDMRIKKMN